MEAYCEPLTLPELFQKEKQKVYTELNNGEAEKRPRRESINGSIPDCLRFILSAHPKTDNTNFNKLILNLATGFRLANFDYPSALEACLSFLTGYPHSSAYPTPQERLEHFKSMWDYTEQNKDYGFSCSYILGMRFPRSAFDCKKCRWSEGQTEEAIARIAEVSSPKPESQQDLGDRIKEQDKENSGGRKELSYLSLDLPSSLEISQMEVKVDWLVQNLIPKESITLLHSIGGVGKTYLMYALGRAVADGDPFFGLDVTKQNVYYVDFENPLPEISDRMKKLGGSENLKIWHLGHDPQPVRFDADEWGIYKTFPPGLFIIDSLRSSHLLEENSSQDAAFIMARHKEIRALGNTIILIHHENKGGGYRGSTAWFDLSDHILKFCRVKAIGSDEDAQEEDLNLPIRLGLGGKSRFSSAMDLAPLYFKFQDGQLARADDPEDEILNRMAELLNPAFPPNQTEFQKLVKENLGIAAKPFRSLLKKGEEKGVWIREKSKTGNKYEYRRA